MTDVQPVFFNPLEEGHVESPWGHFDELRRREPVHHSPIGQWFLFRYDDVSALLRDPNQSVDDENIAHHNSTSAQKPDSWRWRSMRCWTNATGPRIASGSSCPTPHTSCVRL